jgi:acyl-CoA oxidase
MFEASEKLSMNTDSEYHAALMHFGYQLPGSIHKGMYVNCIKMLGTDQQKKELLPQCDSMSMIGCYAQTELGHGSDVQSLETVAEFDSKTDEFVLNSPSVSAAKFWPGDLGLYANYALVFARLMSNGNITR